MASSLSNLVNNRHRTKCKYGHNDKNVKLAVLDISIATAFLNT